MLEGTWILPAIYAALFLSVVSLLAYMRFEAGILKVEQVFPFSNDGSYECSSNGEGGSDGGNGGGSNGEGDSDGGSVGSSGGGSSSGGNSGSGSGGSNGGSSSGGSGGGGGSSGGSGGGSSNGEGSSGGGSPINLKLLQISDIHIRFLKIPLDVITDSINRICPDVVLMTGDYISKASEEHVFLEWMDAFISKTSKSRRLFFMCFGNHEHRAYKGFEAGLSNLKGKLERLGVVVLENMSSTIVKNNRTYTITGFTDLSRNGFDVTTTYHEAGYEPHTRIGMTHNPDLALYLAKGDIDLLVAGHFHGGQIWLPFKLEFILLRREQLCKRGITRGLHSINGNRIYINRGIGSAVLPLRLLSKPELTVINLP